jgi:glucokinase
MKTLGLDLGGTKIAAAVVIDGTVLEQERVDTPQSGFEAVADALAGVAIALLGRHPDVAGIGIGSPGPLDYEQGMVLFAPNIPGMDRAPLVPELQRRLGRQVVLENDANAAGYAEHLYGAASDLESSIYITISTGIGGGLFLGDRLIRGAHGLTGEVGHMVLLPGGPIDGDGHHGTLESLAAGRAIAREGSYGYGRPMTTEEVFELAREGDRKALAIVDNAALFTGIGLANLVKVFDPAGFVIGGGMSQVGTFYLDRIRASVERYLAGYPIPEVRPARLGTAAGVIGAAAVAAHGVSI